MTASVAPHSLDSERAPRLTSLVCFSLLLLLLLPSWLSFIPTWAEERAHGFLVTAYCGWLLWSKRATLRLAGAVQWQTVAIGVASALLWAVAIVIGSRVIHQGAAALVLVAWGLSVFDAAAQRVIVVAGALFLLALPLWEVLLPFLQGVTIVVNHLLIGLFGIPADLQDNLIKFPFGTIEVAQSCAGLAFFSTAVTIGAIYAHHFLQHWRARTAAVVLAMALAMVSNWVRVFGLVYIGYSSKMQSPLMVDHNTYGWIIFAVVMVVYFWLTGRIERWDRRLIANMPVAHVETASAHVATAASGQSTILVTALVAFPLCAYFVLNLRGYPTNLSEPVAGVQRTVAQWSTSPVPEGATRWKPAYRGEALRAAELRVPADTAKYRVVQIDRFGYEGAREGRELVGYGNNIADGKYVLQQGTVGPLDASLRTVNQAIVRDSTGAHLAWYWYNVANVQTASPTKAKLLELISFIGRRTPSEVIVLSAPCDAKDCNRAVASVHLIATGREKP